MKYLFTLISVLVFIKLAFAQEPMKSTIEYNGQKYPCYVMEYNLPPDNTEDIIKNKLKSEGYTANNSKGFLVYRNAKLQNLDPLEAQDVLIKVERKSRKEKDQSLVTIITAKPGEIPEDKVKGAKMVADVTMSPNTISFLNSFQGDFNMEAYNLAVAAQTEEVAKAEKKLDDLRKEQSKIEKKIKDYQDDLSVNKKDQEKQVDEIAKQKKLLQDKVAQKPVQ